MLIAMSTPLVAFRLCQRDATPEELSQKVVVLIDRLRRLKADRPEGAELVYVTWRALPQPDETA